MSESEILEKLKKILSEYVDEIPAELSMDTKLISGLGMDSVGLLSTVWEVEKQFDVHISDEDVMKLQTIGDIVKYLSKA